MGCRVETKLETNLKQTKMWRTSRRTTSNLVYTLIKNPFGITIQIMNNLVHIGFVTASLSLCYNHHNIFIMALLCFISTDIYCIMNVNTTRINLFPQHFKSLGVAIIC